MTLEQILQMSVPERWELAKSDVWQEVCTLMAGMNSGLDEAYLYHKLRELVDTQLGLAWEAIQVLTTHHPESHSQTNLELVSQ